MRVGIAGIGGIGSNVARHLVQARVTNFLLVDFDAVEETNLNRQFYTLSQVGLLKTTALVENLLAIAPVLDIDIKNCRIATGDARRLFKDCNIVVEGFDDKHLKKMLVEELAATGQRIVSASGIGGRNLEKIGVRRVGNCRVVGDFISDQDDYPVYPPKIAIVAATMAALILEELEGSIHD